VLYLQLVLLGLMIVKKLNIDELEDDNVYLFALHTTLEDYRLAYHLNKELRIQLCKANHDLKIVTTHGSSGFTLFNYEDEEHFANWDLIQNKAEIHENLTTTAYDLFSIEKKSVQSRVYLVPEFKKADYMLKVTIPENVISIPNIVAQMQSINKVSTAYEVDFYTIKSKNNLIF